MYIICPKQITDNYYKCLYMHNKSIFVVRNTQVYTYVRRWGPGQHVYMYVCVVLGLRQHREVCSVSICNRVIETLFLCMCVCLIVCRWCVCGRSLSTQMQGVKFNALMYAGLCTYMQVVEGGYPLSTSAHYIMPV